MLLHCSEIHHSGSGRGILVNTETVSYMVATGLKSGLPQTDIYFIDDTKLRVKEDIITLLEQSGQNIVVKTSQKSD